MAGVEHSLKSPSEIFNLDSFITWLAEIVRTPEGAARQYEWWDIKDCLICHYLQSCGAPQDGGEVLTWAKENFGKGYDDVFSNIGDYHYIGGSDPWTYGAALKRALKVKRGLSYG